MFWFTLFTLYPIFFYFVLINYWKSYSWFVVFLFVVSYSIKVVQFVSVICGYELLIILRFIDYFYVMNFFPPYDGNVTEIILYIDEILLKIKSFILNSLDKLYCSVTDEGRTIFECEKDSDFKKRREVFQIENNSSTEKNILQEKLEINKNNFDKHVFIFVIIVGIVTTIQYNIL